MNLNTNFHAHNQAYRQLSTLVMALLVTVSIVPSAGCQTFGNRRGSSDVDLVDWAETGQSQANATQSQSGVVTAGNLESPGDPSAVVQADGDSAAYYDSGKNENRLVGFLANLRENIPSAKKAYQRGDSIFRGAKGKPRTDALRDFSKAANYFRNAGEAAPGSALEQDSLFMQAESHFFANELNEATKTYQKLAKEFPRNRFNDRVNARLFEITKYWINASKAGADAWYKVNLFDNSLPSYDIKGQAVKVLDQIRYDDPTSQIADDATMAAAVEFMRQRDFDKADEFLTDLRQVFTDSDHMFMAHLLGIQCKLEIYAGPNYSGLVLEEAEKLIEQVGRRFPNEIQDPKYAEMVARSSKMVAFYQAERYENRAKYREKKGEYGAATSLYRQLVAEYPSTPQAKIARARIGETSNLRAVPEQRLAWLTKIFPDSKKSTPLKMVGGSKSNPSNPSSGTMLR